MNITSSRLSLLQPFVTGKATDVCVLQLALHASGSPLKQSFVQLFFFSVCKKIQKCPESQANQCWHFNNTSQWIQKSSIFPFQSVIPFLFTAIIIDFSLSEELSLGLKWHKVRFIKSSSAGLLWLYMALGGSFIICTAPSSGPPHQAGPGLSCYLVASLIVCLMDWLAAFELAQTDQISQHFVHYGFMKDRGVTCPLLLVTIILSHQKSEFVSTTVLVVEQWVAYSKLHLIILVKYIITYVMSMTSV